jgi:hypothetical protein
MDLGSSVIGIIFLLLCALPFILMSRSRKKREKSLMQALTNMATEKNCKIHQHELFANFAIGFDNSNAVVMFYRKIGEMISEQFVYLQDVQSCKVLNASRTVAGNSGNQKIIEKLELVFIPSIKSKPEVRLEFFNASITPQLFGELQSIQKWALQLTDIIKEKK